MRRCNPCRLSLATLAVSLASLPAFADWELSDYRTLAADSVAVNMAYSIQPFSNRSSVVGLSVERDSSGGFLRFNASKIASDGTEGHTANLGVLHPLTPDWATHDLTSLTGIRFEFRNSAPITENLAVILGSGAYSYEQDFVIRAKHEIVLSGKTALAASSTWKEVVLEAADFATPTWWTAPPDAPSLEQCLKLAKYIEFAPRTLYAENGTQSGTPCTKCVGPTMTSLILDIRKVTLLGSTYIPPPPPIDSSIIAPPPPPPPPSGYLVSTYSKPTLDSASTAATYGIVSAANPASQAMALVPGGFVRLEAPIIASELASAPNGNGYSAYVGLIHPLRADWREADLRKLTAIRFQFRNYSKITSVLNLSFGSSAYSLGQEQAGTVYSNDLGGAKRMSADTSWKSATIDVMDFATPAWWMAPVDFPTLDSVLSRVRSIQFNPQTTYSDNGTSNGQACTKCVGPTMPKQRLDIREVRLMGIDSLELVPLVEPPTPLVNDSCKGPRVVQLDNFYDGNTWNQLGGSWFTYADTGRSAVEHITNATGSSSAFLTIQPGVARMETNLDKTVDDVWHSRAGWAGVSSYVQRGLDLEGLTAIQFTLETDSITPTAGLFMKVHESGFPMDSAYSAPIPTKNGVVCILVDSLKSNRPRTSNPSRLNLSKIDRFSWEAKIQDESHPFISQAQANFSLRNVKLYGADPVRVSQSLARLRHSSFGVSYQQGILHMVGIDGIGQIEVRNLQGRTVASFVAGSRVPLQLSNGTYILSAKRNGVPLTKSFAVMGR